MGWDIKSTNSTPPTDQMGPLTPSRHRKGTENSKSIYGETIRARECNVIRKPRPRLGTLAPEAALTTNLKGKGNLPNFAPPTASTSSQSHKHYCGQGTPPYTQQRSPVPRLGHADTRPKMRCWFQSGPIQVQLRRFTSSIMA